MIASSSWLRRRVRALFHRGEVEAEMHAELALHFDLRVRELEREGLSPLEARRRAVADFEGLDHTREAYRDARGIRPLENLMQDIRYAFRSLLRQRAFSIAAVLTFAVGIGATTAIYSLVDTAWFGWARSFPEAERLAFAYKTFPQGRGAVSPQDYRDWRDQSRTFDKLGAYIRTGVTIVDRGEPARYNAAAITPNLFPAVGVRPALGRFFRDDETQWGANHVVILSHSTWKNTFGSDPQIVGRRITVDGSPSEIVGVAPPGAWFAARSPDVFVPMSFAPDDPTNNRRSHFLFSIGRLAPGQTVEAANAELRLIADRIAAIAPENVGSRAEVVPAEEIVLGEVKPTMRMLLAAAALLLVIAVANVTNLLLVRTTGRVRELAVRSALGASRPRIVQQLLTESVVLALAGGILGVLIASLIVRTVGGTLPTDLPRIRDVGLSIDWRVLGISLAIVLGGGIVCGILPAFDMLRRNRGQAATDALRQGTRSVAGGRRMAYIRSMLVSAQVALALVLMISSGLLARSLVSMQREETGVDPVNVVSVRLNPAPSRLQAEDRGVRFYDDVIARMSAIPGVELVGVTSHLPRSGGGESKSFWVEGRAPSRAEDVPSVVGRMVSPDMLRALGVPLLRGRWFTQQDRDGSLPVVIIGESIAKKYFNGTDPIGQRISMRPPEALVPPTNRPPGFQWTRFTVIGVVKDVQYRDARDVKEEAVYVNYPQGKKEWTWGPTWLVVKAPRPAVQLQREVREALKAVDPNMPITDLRPLGEQMNLSLRAPRFTAVLITTFAIVAAALGVIGLYGVIAYSVAQETPAFGVRLALGATPRDITSMVLRRGAVLAVAGVAIGVAGAVASGRVIAAQLFGVQPLDLPTYIIASAALIAVAVLACWIPARRAGGIDALSALRAD